MSENDPELSPLAPSRRHWGDLLKHRWPTLFGLILALVTALGGGIIREFLSSVSTLLVFMAFIYLATAVLGRRSAVWPVFLIGLVVITLLRFLELSVVAIVVFWLVALAFLVLSVLQRRWRRGSGLPLETLGLIAFSTVALVMLSVDPTAARYLAALGLFAHAAWDAVHLWRNRVVTRSYAEFCAVLDTVLGVAILAMR